MNLFSQFSDDEVNDAAGASFTVNMYLLWKCGFVTLQDLRDMDPNLGDEIEALVFRSGMDYAQYLAAAVKKKAEQSRNANRPDPRRN